MICASAIATQPAGACSFFPGLFTSNENEGHNAFSPPTPDCPHDVVSNGPTSSADDIPQSPQIARIAKGTTIPPRLNSSLNTQFWKSTRLTPASIQRPH